MPADKADPVEKKTIAPNLLEAQLKQQPRWWAFILYLPVPGVIPGDTRETQICWY